MDADDSRDDMGRFLPGNGGGPGREPGSKNKFTELKHHLLEAYATAVEQDELQGVAFWRFIKRTRPGLFARLLVSLLPRELLATIEHQEPLRVVMEYVTVEEATAARD